MLLIGEGRRMSGEDDVAMLRTLTADLGRVIEGGGPTPEQLAAAPLIEGWSVSVMPVICLLGTLTGEGRAPRPVFQTTDLWAFAPTLGWTRTLASYYRLGAPRAPELGGPVGGPGTPPLVARTSAQQDGT